MGLTVLRWQMESQIHMNHKGSCNRCVAMLWLLPQFLVYNWKQHTWQSAGPLHWFSDPWGEGHMIRRAKEEASETLSCYQASKPNPGKCTHYHPRLNCLPRLWLRITVHITMWWLTAVESRCGISGHVPVLSGHTLFLPKYKALGQAAWSWHSIWSPCASGLCHPRAPLTVSAAMLLILTGCTPCC